MHVFGLNQGKRVNSNQKDHSLNQDTIPPGGAVDVF